MGLRLSTACVHAVTDGTSVAVFSGPSGWVCLFSQGLQVLLRFAVACVASVSTRSDRLGRGS